MLQNELKEIRTQLRLAMNGVISTSMREEDGIYRRLGGFTYVSPPDPPT